jgi:hypothetical protein
LFAVANEQGFRKEGRLKKPFGIHDNAIAWLVYPTPVRDNVNTIPDYVAIEFAIALRSMCFL